MNILIRKANVKDINEIQKIAKITWHDTYKELIPEEIQNKFLEMAYSYKSMIERVENSIMLLAEKNDQVVGFINLFIKETDAELSAIYIYPEFQRKSIGTKLLEAAKNNLHEVSIIYVDVEIGNIPGESFYREKGFKLYKEFDDEFFGHKLRTKRLVLEQNHN